MFRKWQINVKNAHHSFTEEKVTNLELVLLIKPTVPKPKHLSFTIINDKVKVTDDAETCRWCVLTAIPHYVFLQSLIDI